MNQTIRRFALPLFVTLTLALTFSAYWLPFPPDSAALLFPVVVVIVPTLVAFSLSLLEGGDALRRLLGTFAPGRWRWVWIALGLGAAMQIFITLGGLLLGFTSSVTFNLTPVFLALIISTPILALGEEIGWRGYALSRMMTRYSLLVSSLLLGIPWALVHLSLYLPGMMFVGRPVLAQVGPIVLFSVVHAWVFVKSGSKLLAPALLHGIFNAFGALLNSTLTPVQAAYLGAASLTLTAIVVVAIEPPFWLKRPPPDAPAS